MNKSGVSGFKGCDAAKPILTVILQRDMVLKDCVPLLEHDLQRRQTERREPFLISPAHLLRLCTLLCRDELLEVTDCVFRTAVDACVNCCEIANDASLLTCT